MAERRTVYSVHRNILDEGAVDDMAGRSESKTQTLSEKVKKAMRCSAPCLKSFLLRSVPLLSWLPRYPIREYAIGDLIAGITVGVMQLPLGMAVALLASVPPVFGLYSGFYPVLIYFIFGTSKHISVGAYAVVAVMIGGATERLIPDSDFMIWDNVTNSSIVDTVSRDAGRVRVAAAVTFLSGVFQISLGLAQFGLLVTYLSEPLVRGYTTGAAFYIIVSQLKSTFGIHYKSHSGPLSVIYVIIATVISGQVNLEQKYGVDVVGTIPPGLQPPVFPDVSLFGQVVVDAFAVSVVGYGMVISLGRIFALKYGYKVDSNQELIALGLSNSFGGLFQALSVGCSISRSAIQDSTGGKTQVAGALSAIVALIIVLWIGALFKDLPKAVLAAIIYVTLQGTLKQFLDIPVLWRKNKVDALIWVATFLLTLLLNPDLGLAASIGFSMLTVIFRTQLPKYSLLGQVPGTDIYRPLEEYNQVRQVPGILIFHSSATLYFANAEMYQDALEKKSDIDVAKILSVKKQLEDKRRRLEKAIAKKAKKNGVPSQHKDITAVIQMDVEHEPSYPQAIVLDLSPVNFLDTVGIKALQNIQRDYGEIGIEVVLAGCQTGVVDNLQTGGFLNDNVTRSCLFSTIHDAVLHFQSARMKDENSSQGTMVTESRTP